MLPLCCALTSAFSLGGCDVEEPSELDAQPVYWVGPERLDAEHVPDDSAQYLDDSMEDDDSAERSLNDDIPDIVAETDSTASVSWTQWFDRDNPSGTGDWELRHLQSGVCASPSGVQCRTVQGLYLWETGENVSCSIDGLLCENDEQPDGQCDHDYKVRFLCPDDEEPPTAGLTYLRPMGAECVGPLVGFFAGASTAGDNPIDEYQWDFNDDGIIDQTTASAFTNSVYAGPSSEVACVTVVDTAGFSDTACVEFDICG